MLYKVVIDTDSIACVGFLSSGCLPTHSSAPLVEEIRSLLPCFVDITWGHVFCEANAVADALAKHGLNLNQECLIFDILPSFCSTAFLLDSASTFHVRGM